MNRRHEHWLLRGTAVVGFLVMLLGLWLLVTRG
jgi:hypothetical protein